MSKWYEVTKEDVSIGLDNQTIDVNFDSDEFGNVWVSIPIEVIKDLIKENE